MTAFAINPCRWIGGLLADALQTYKYHLNKHFKPPRERSKSAHSTQRTLTEHSYIRRTPFRKWLFAHVQITSLNAHSVWRMCIMYVQIWMLHTLENCLNTLGLIPSLRILPPSNLWVLIMAFELKPNQSICTNHSTLNPMNELQPFSISKHYIWSFILFSFIFNCS